MSDLSHDPIDLVLLERYAAGDCSAAEAECVEGWVAANPAVAQRIDEMRQIGTRAQALLSGQAFDSRTGFETMLDRFTGGRPLSASVPGRRPMLRVSSPKPSWRWPFASRGMLVQGSALVAIAAMAVLVVVWNVMPGKRSSTQPFREFVSPAGSRMTLVLRDGTQMTLGPDTRAQIPLDFGVSTRTVSLQGEAVFAVVHDPRHPFIVHTAKGDVNDIGTTFAVTAYRDDPTEQVAVAEGEVGLFGSVLRANDVASIDGHGFVTVRRGGHVAPYVDWAQGQLVFEDTPLRDVVRTLKRTYNVDVRIADTSLAGQLVTASFTNESVTEVLDVITRVVSARYDRVGHVVVIRARPRIPTSGKALHPLPLSTVQNNRI